MCHLNWDLDGLAEAYSQPLPILRWAIPVDIAQLGSSLEAYDSIQSATFTLRLCHRFRPGPLSRLPQEIVELIVEEAHRSEQVLILTDWERDYSCFQDRCSFHSHFRPYSASIEYACEALSDELYLDVGPELLEYSPEEKAEHIAGFLADNPGKENDAVADIGLDVHWDRAYKWCSRTCSCTVGVSREEGAFVKLNSLLKSHFGLEAIVLHEALSDPLNSLFNALARGGMSDQSMNTLCFLALPSRPSPDPTKSSHGSRDQAGSFATTANPFAFWQVIDPSIPPLSQKQKRRFAKAMRVLSLKPCLQLRQLEPIIEPLIREREGIRDRVDAFLDKHTEDATLRKNDDIDKFRRFLTSKSKEIAGQAWPQLMMLASSPVVVPSRTNS